MFSLSFLSSCPVRLPSNCTEDEDDNSISGEAAGVDPVLGVEDNREFEVESAFVCAEEGFGFGCDAVTAAVSPILDLDVGRDPFVVAGVAVAPALAPFKAGLAPTELL